LFLTDNPYGSLPFRKIACTPLNRRPHRVSKRSDIGGARGSGSALDAVVSVFSCRWVSIFWITSGSSIQAITFIAPPQSWQVVMSILNTRFSRCAHVIAACRSMGVRSAGESDFWNFRPLPRWAGVISARYLQLGASTP